MVRETAEFKGRDAETEKPSAFGDRVRSAVIWRSGSQILAQVITWAATLAVIRLLDPAVLHGAGHFSAPHQGQGAGGISAAIEVARIIDRLERARHTRKRDAYAEKKATASTHRLGCAAT